MTDDHMRWTYEQIAKQIEREDNLYQARIGSCIVVNLALLAAAATQINRPGLDLKNLAIILGCSAAGFLITHGIRSAVASGERQLAYLRGLFEDLAAGLPVALPRPFLGGAAPDPKKEARHLKKLFFPWNPIVLVFQLMWGAILILALLLLLVFLFPDIIA